MEDLGASMPLTAAVAVPLAALSADPVVAITWFGLAVVGALLCLKVDASQKVA